MTWGKSHTFWGPCFPHLPKSHLGFSGLMRGAWGLEGRCQARRLPPPPAPHLVDHPINLHRDDEVGVVHRLWGAEKELLGRGPQRPPTPKSRAGPLRDPRAAGCWAGPTLKELCTRVSSRSMTTQILSASWAFASGSRYWTGVCCRDGRGSWGHLPQGQVTSPSPSPLSGETPPPSRLCPCQLEPGAGHLALGLTSPPGEPRERKAFILWGKSRSPLVEGPSLG